MISGIRSDLTQMLALQRQSRELSHALDIATQELSTGRKQDLVAASEGNLARLHGMDTRLAQIASDQSAIDLFDRRAELADAALAGVQEMLDPIGTEMQAAAINGDAARARSLATDAAARMEGVIGILNSTTGGRALFAGANTDGPAIATADTLMTVLRAAIAAAPEGEDAVATFFADGGGYETLIYAGAEPGAAGSLSTGAPLANMPTANAPEIRFALEGLARAALSLTADDPVARQIEAGATLANAGREVIALREGLGADRYRLEIMKDVLKAEETSTSLARASITSADPHETAARLQGLEAQLQALYVVTARLSSLSIVNFMR
ncbi:flagellar hook-associated protein 3 FlgL [Rubricella aquisinus]|uniref:Flagellar hook-associated protein 3 FlgL n=1 Tax=Rubricella aquisinus TaxID=2028108 RepID=A0A840X3K7_9RHOB|nr:flagellin [Rubricella aquisinus]MBB5515257.1 flagellar hook-associated protein 3 FlgL [Rubricella aquisinus]